MKVNNKFFNYISSITATLCYCFRPGARPSTEHTTQQEERPKPAVFNRREHDETMGKTNRYLSLSLMEDGSSISDASSRNVRAPVDSTDMKVDPISESALDDGTLKHPVEESSCTTHFGYAGRYTFDMHVPFRRAMVLLWSFFVRRRGFLRKNYRERGTTACAFDVCCIATSIYIKVDVEEFIKLNGVGAEDKRCRISLNIFGASLIGTKDIFCVRRNRRRRMRSEALFKTADGLLSWLERNKKCSVSEPR